MVGGVSEDKVSVRRGFRGCVQVRECGSPPFPVAQGCLCSSGLVFRDQGSVQWASSLGTTPSPLGPPCPTAPRCRPCSPWSRSVGPAAAPSALTSAPAWCSCPRPPRRLLGFPDLGVPQPLAAVPRVAGHCPQQGLTSPSLAAAPQGSALWVSKAPGPPGRAEAGLSSLPLPWGVPPAPAPG